MSLTEKNLDDLKRREDFGQTIRLLREKMELSTQELATELQVTTDYLLKTEQNTTSPSKFFIHHLARALGMSYEDLVDSLYYVDSNSIDTLLKNN
ncbi:helix-turn-helix domain-containing protein [Bacillus sp. DJP31]|uniref:helix-turn-helix domain-containing protein n=1 Tax=Bacillus sp. DJP31 TaxID=3409789 RepID=UPI003BB51155